MTRIAAAVLALAVAAPSPALADGTRRFGLMADAGLPDGATGALVYRPVSWLRLHAGGGYNLVSPGVRCGLTFAPFPGTATLTFNVDGGRYFDGDANPLARTLTGDSTIDVAALRDVGYDYANLHAGFEWGQTYATFYIHAGMSYVTGEMKNASETFSDIDPYTTVEFNGNPRVTIWTPSLRLGLIIYFMR